MANTRAKLRHWSVDALGLSEAQPVRVHRFTHRGSDNLRHDHDFLEVLLSVDGRAIHETDAGAEPMGRGRAVVVPPGVFHALYDCEAFEILNCAILPSLFAGELAWLQEDAEVGRLLRRNGRRHRVGAPLVLELQDEVFQRCLGLVAPAVTPRREPMRLGRAAAVGRALALLGELGAELTEREGAAGAIPSVVRRAAEALEDEPAREWHMEELARAVNCSKAYLTRQFTDALGVSPMAYLAQLRAQAAAVWLRRTDLAVASVGERVGYWSPEHFSRRFREHYRLSPSRYRGRHRVE